MTKTRNSPVSAMLSAVQRCFILETTFTITPENIETAKQLLVRQPEKRGRVLCSRWQFSKILGHDAYCGVTDPQPGDILVWQCDHVG